MAEKKLYALAAARKQRLRKVGISDMIISDNPRETLITYALGSCIAVMLYDARLRIGGMLHYLLPNSRETGERKLSPLAYGDTGVTLLVEEMQRRGDAHQRLIVKVAGGAAVLKNCVDVGRQNYQALLQVLHNYRLQIFREAVGGDKSRTVLFEIATGRVTIRCNRQLLEL